MMGALQNKCALFYAMRRSYGTIAPMLQTPRPDWAFGISMAIRLPLAAVALHCIHHQWHHGGKPHIGVGIFALFSL